MNIQLYTKRVSKVAISVTFLWLFFFVSVVGAETISSPNYTINGNLDGNFSGQGTSTNYKMTTIGGEAIIGAGQSGSYILNQEPTMGSPSMRLSVQPSGLVAYYPLDEGTGSTTADASQYQNDGTTNGGVQWYPGKIGGSLDINNAGAVSVPDNSNLPTGSAMTISAWVKANAWENNDATIISQWTYPGAPGWAIQTGTNYNLRVFIAGSPSDFGDNYIDTDANTWNVFGAWRHVVMVYDGTASASSRAKIYIDGALVGATTYGTIPATLQNSSSPLSIGEFPGLTRYMNGAIDQVKIFNRALSASEISAEYQAQNAGVATGLTLGSLTGNSSTSLVDAIVRTSAQKYSLAIEQDHNLQSGANTIPSVSGTIPSPQTWSDGVTKGVGFTLMSAPTLDGKWSNGANYAAIPSSATSFYTGIGHVNSIVDVVQLRLRLDPGPTQAPGAYTNNVTYTGTTIP